MITPPTRLLELKSSGALKALEASLEEPVVWDFSPRFTGEAKFQRPTDVAGQDPTRSEIASFENIKLTLEHDLKGRDAVGYAAEELKLFEGLSRDTDGKLTRGRPGRSSLPASHGPKSTAGWAEGGRDMRPACPRAASGYRWLGKLD